MKGKMVIIFLVVIFSSCQTAKIPKEDLQWNYELIDRIVNNPDSLQFFLTEPYYDPAFHRGNKEDNRDEVTKLGNMIIKKLKDNDFKSGYSITDEIFEDVKDAWIRLKWHSMLIKSKKTGKKIFFKFRYYGGDWDLFDIHTIILSDDRILEY
jgi:hypothetical protein